MVCENGFDYSSRFQLLHLLRNYDRPDIVVTAAAANHPLFLREYLRTHFENGPALIGPKYCEQLDLHSHVSCHGAGEIPVREQTSLLHETLMKFRPRPQLLSLGLIASHDLVLTDTPDRAEALREQFPNETAKIAAAGQVLLICDQGAFGANRIMDRAAQWLPAYVDYSIHARNKNSTRGLENDPTLSAGGRAHAWNLAFTGRLDEACASSRQGHR
jgi:hypothetical protein